MSAALRYAVFYLTLIFLPIYLIEVQGRFGYKTNINQALKRPGMPAGFRV